jgi:hypothetical protein
MTTSAFNFIEPLLTFQTHISRVDFVSNESKPPRTIPLDLYRDLRGIQLRSGNISTWMRKIVGVNVKSEDQWLVTKPRIEEGYLACCFTQRYRNSSIDYSFLSQVPDVRFVGLESEYLAFVSRYELKKVAYVKVRDAMEMADVIAGSKLFLGNQSFAFAVAEGLKINRALEVCEIVPNVIPTGQGANDYLYQQALTTILNASGFQVSSMAPNRVPAPCLFLQ